MNLHYWKMWFFLYLQLLTLHVTSVLTSDTVATMWNNSRHAQIAHRFLKDFGDLEMHWQQ